MKEWVGIRGVLSTFRAARMRWPARVVFTAASLISCSSVQAQDQSHSQFTPHEQNVETMLELMGVPEQVNKVAADILKLYSARLSAGDTGPEVTLIIDDYQQQAAQIINATLGWDSLKSTYIKNYANRFSERDIVIVTNFLNSPTGQKFIASQLDAGVEIQSTTKMLMEAKIIKQMTQLTNSLSESLVKLRASENPK